jgi:hypothetical protein
MNRAKSGHRCGDAARAAKEQIMNSYTVAFIGAGKISEAWMERLIGSGAVPAEKILASDPSNDRLEYVRARYAGLKTTTDNFAGAQFGSLLVIRRQKSFLRWQTFSPRYNSARLSFLLPQGCRYRSSYPLLQALQYCA